MLMHACVDASVSVISVTGEWEYDRRLGQVNGKSAAATADDFARLNQKFIKRRCVPVNLRMLEQSLRPQPCMADVIERLSGWIDRENDAVCSLEASPDFQTPSVDAIFPDSEEWV